MATPCRYHLARHRRQFFATYKGLQRWHRKTGDQLDASGKVLTTTTLAGRRRLEVRKFTDALNTPVQGSGADGLKMALGRLYRHGDEAPTAKLVAVVHDEIIAECPAKDVDSTAAWLQRHMGAAMDELVREQVPIVVETKAGQTWAG
jgi:DNA polymerase-1